MWMLLRPRPENSVQEIIRDYLSPDLLIQTHVLLGLFKICSVEGVHLISNSSIEKLGIPQPQRDLSVPLMNLFASLQSQLSWKLWVFVIRGK